MCTYHVFSELSAKVVAACTPSWMDHFNGHLFELVRSVPQAAEGSPASCVDFCICARVCAPCSQVRHFFDSFSAVKGMIQLQTLHRESLLALIYAYAKCKEDLFNKGDFHFTFHPFLCCHRANHSFFILCQDFYFKAQDDIMSLQGVSGVADQR